MRQSRATIIVFRSGVKRSQPFLLHLNGLRWYTNTVLLFLHRGIWRIIYGTKSAVKFSDVFIPVANYSAHLHALIGFKNLEMIRNQDYLTLQADQMHFYPGAFWRFWPRLIWSWTIRTLWSWTFIILKNFLSQICSRTIFQMHTPPGACLLYRHWAGKTSYVSLAPEHV